MFDKTRTDRYGKEIKLKKHQIPNDDSDDDFESEHKVTFVDQISNRIKQYKDHPKTKVLNGGATLQNKVLKFEKLVTFKEPRAFKNIIYCESYK